MKIFISHKFQREDKERLKEKLKKIVGWLEGQGFEVFCYLRDKEKWEPKNLPPGKVIKEAFEKIKECDAFWFLLIQKKKAKEFF